MCGIYCFIGKKKALPILTTGLSTLEYRGYDSSGIAYVTDKINIIKAKGTLDHLENLLDKDTRTYLGIGHTRWATHGEPNCTNAHPHQQGHITLVHNGIVENYQDLKKELTEYNLKSDTDTEVLCCLIDKLYKQEKDMIKTLSKLKDMVKGSYALGIIVDDDLNSLYAIKKNSPLILAKSTIGNFIASDIQAILPYTNTYLLLENDEVAHLTKENIHIYNQDGMQIEKDIKISDESYECSCKNGYEHFMLKEIYEQPEAIVKTIQSLQLSSLPTLRKYKKIHIVGCGSAYHAGIVGKYIIEKYCDIEVYVEIASEYRYKKCFYDPKTLVIFISQSGETADTLACVKKVKNENIDTLGIVNVKDSSLAREVDYVIYTQAGCEIAVATTKAYSTQIVVLALLALGNQFQEDDIISGMQKVFDNTYQHIAKKIYQCQHIFFIGRGMDYALCLEGSLKLKEISYIHSEAYMAGELKHGTISLIDENTYVIAINTFEKLSEKMISNIKEVKARKAKVIYITTTQLDREDTFYDEKIVIPTTLDYLQPLLIIIVLQLIAYYTAKLKGCEIDKPKNLAKSVTVE